MLLAKGGLLRSVFCVCKCYPKASLVKKLPEKSFLVSQLLMVYCIATDHVIAAMRDRASTNNVAMNTSPSGYRVLLPHFRSDRRAVCGPYSQ